MAYQAIFIGVVGPAYYWFAARTNVNSLNRRWPRLKWVLAGIGLAIGLGGVQRGTVLLPPPLANRLDPGVSNRIAVRFVILCLALAMAVNAEHCFRTREPEGRRKFRLLFWSTVVGLGPTLLRVLLQNYTWIPVPAWMDSLSTALLWVLPFAFAYAVLVHRVLEIPVLLKRSARYLLVQRGFTVLLSLASIALTLLFAGWIST